MRFADITIDCILKFLDTLAPFSLAEDWDNVGLLIGDPRTQVSGIMIGLDPTASLLDEALATNANLVITHHPIIFSALKSIRTDQPTGVLIAKAISEKIAIIACHTNLDVVPNGVSHTLAQRLGLTEISPLTSTPSAAPIGFVQVGTLPAPISSQVFLSNLCSVLGVPAVSVAGPLPDTIQRVAVCGGSGSEFATMAQACGAQLYITAEVKHHIARWAEECQFCIIDAGHFATEHLISEALASRLANTLANNKQSIAVHVTKKQKNPFSFFMAEKFSATI